MFDQVPVQWFQQQQVCCRQAPDCGSEGADILAPLTSITIGVMPACARLQVLRAIKLDDQFSGKADEIDNVRSDRRLSSEFVAAKLLSAEELPEMFFSAGGGVAQRAGEIALIAIAEHG
ncbi:MAG TPA: hypothetical protein VH744_06225 [Terriglobales bacterium]